MVILWEVTTFGLMIFSTRGIVLRTVKYGDTSIIATVYTQLFGLQSYLINGVRTAGKSSTAYLYQPASILSLQAYHNELKNLQRIKEASWSHVYSGVSNHVIRNTVALFIVELLQKVIRHEEQNEELYNFTEKTLLLLDRCVLSEAADIPVIFSLALTEFLGFKLVNNHSASHPYFNPEEGKFTVELGDQTIPDDPDFHKLYSELLSISEFFNPEQEGNPIPALKLNGYLRRRILRVTETYFKWHIPGFSELKTLQVFEQMA